MTKAKNITIALIVTIYASVIGAANIIVQDDIGRTLAQIDHTERSA